MDVIANDLQDLVKNYNTKQDTFVQDSYTSDPKKTATKTGKGIPKNKLTQDTAETTDADTVDSQVQVNADKNAESIVNATTKLNNVTNNNSTIQEQSNVVRHDELVKNDNVQNKHLSGIKGTMDDLYRLMFNDIKGPNVETYKREEKDNNEALSRQLDSQHKEQVDILEQIRDASRRGMGGFFGGGGSVFGGGADKGKGKGDTKKTPRVGGKAKIAMAVAGGIATLWGGNKVLEYMGGSATENAPKSIDELKMESEREAQGLEPLEGQDLIDFRSSVTRNSGATPNPNTGLPLNTLQRTAVESGYFTVKEATDMDPSDLYDGLQERGVQLQVSQLQEAEAENVGSGFGYTDAAMTAVTAASAGYAIKNRGAIKDNVGAKIDSAKQATASKITDIKEKVSSAKQAVADKATSVANKGAAVAEKVHPKTGTALRKGAGTVAKTTGKVAGKAGAALKKVPVLGTALTAYEAYDILSDDTMTTGEKAGEMTDLAGGVAGGLAGAAVGQALIPIPVVGALIGGIAGYTLGEAGVESAREAIGNFFSGDDEEEEGVEAEQVQTIAKKLGEKQGPLPTEKPIIGNAPASKIMGAASARKKANTLGSVSEKYESGGRGAGTISTGIGDPGGVSYGTYQLASNTGTLGAYLAGSKYASKLQGDVNSPEFKASWKKLAQEDPEGFEKDQHDFIKGTHYEPVRNEFVKQTGMDPVQVDNMAGLSNALWSQSVQHSFKGNKAIINNAVNTAGKNANESAYVNALYGARSAYVGSLSMNANTKASLQNRFQNESTDALQLAGQTTGSVVGASAAMPAPTPSSSSYVGTAMNEPTVASAPKSPMSAEESMLNSVYNATMGVAGMPSLNTMIAANSSMIGNAPAGMANIASVSPTNSQASSPTAGSITTQAVNDEPATRKQYESVKKVMMIDQKNIAAKGTKKESLTKPPRSPSTASYLSSNTQPNINETPAIVADHGLMLLNTGFI